jgi:hypothetical protein
VPRVRKYDTNAQRQAAYRQRHSQQGHIGHLSGPIPSKPAIASMPGHRRWSGMLAGADALIRCMRDEMQQYCQERSESWQDSEAGEKFMEILDSVEDALRALEEVPYQTS